MSVTNPNFPDCKAMMEVLVQQLRQVGINAKLEQFDQATWFRRQAEKQFDISCYFTRYGPDPDAFREHFMTGGGRNNMSYSNPELDALAQKAATLQRQGERQQDLPPDPGDHRHRSALHQPVQRAEDDADPRRLVRLQHGTGGLRQGRDLVRLLHRDAAGKVIPVEKQLAGAARDVDRQYGRQVGNPVVRRYLLLRVLQLVPVTLVVIVLNFLLVHLAPGDVSIMLAGDNADPAYLASIRERYGLDRPFLEQLWRYLVQVGSGDLGVSFRSREPVFAEIMSRVPATLLLVGTSLALSVVMGTLIGALIARRPGSALDSSVSALAVAMFSIPVFWFGLMLIPVFAVELQILPAMGMSSVDGPRTGFGRMLDVAQHMVLPVLALTHGLPRAICPPVAKRGRGGDGRRLHHDGPRHWLSRAHHPAALRVAQRAAAGDHGTRSPARAGPDGGRAHRDGVLVARSRASDLRRHPGARYARHHGRVHHYVGDGRAGLAR